ncbi:hypothetical protein V2A60_004633 [Cordyceps javanica]|uniref:Protein transport protein Sec39 n=1 Tax=Cordyceps javanica TaxID=43265 RepID=A0A545VBQ9_9HYPO|nr:protein transport protein Sec39 [Cordyceps javanica]
MKGKELSPAKVLLLAAHLAAQKDVRALAALAYRNDSVLRPEVLLRVLLTYLPETVEPCAYTELLRDLSDGQVGFPTDLEPDTSPVDSISDETATKKAKKLRLLPLSGKNTTTFENHDSICEFLLRRTYRINTEIGALSQLPELLQPFTDSYPYIKYWAASTVFPFVRRSLQCYVNASSEYSLAEFENLPDRNAAIFLLSESTKRDGETVGRALRGLVAPWLYNESRWKASESDIGMHCPGWEQVQNTILSWATKSWNSAAGAIKHWEGPRDVYFGENLTISLPESKLRFLQKTYATTAVACLYSMTESSEEALRSSYQICCLTRKRLDETDSLPTLERILLDISLLPAFKMTQIRDPKMAAFMRQDLLKMSNPLTSGSPESLQLITALTISAYLSTSLGVPWSVRKAGDLLFIGDEREQKGELNKLLRAVANQAPRDDNSYWRRSRDVIIWLSTWAHHAKPTDLSSQHNGPLGMVPREHIETEFLKTLLSKSSMDFY